MTIGRNSGFESFGVDFWRLVAGNKIKVEDASGTVVNLLKLIKNRIPCYVNDELSIFWGLKNLAQNAEYDSVKHGWITAGAVISTEWGHLGYTKHANRFPFKQDFIEKLDKILINMKSNGRINTIVNQYIDDGGS